MRTTTTSPPTYRAVQPDGAAKDRPRWTWTHWLAIAGAPILLLELWTVTAWLLDSPYQVTAFRAPGSVNWWACRIYEGVAILVALIIVPYVVRQCRRERRLTFDAHFLLAGALIWWADAGVNAFVPTFLFSSNFVNVTNPLGHMPFMVNPDVGRMPDPILFTIPLESCGLLAVAMGIGALHRWSRRRWPHWSSRQILAFIVAVSLVAEMLIELPIVALGLWTYTSPLGLSVPLGHGLRFGDTEFLAGTCFFMLPALLRIYKDDRGRTIAERGLERYGPRKRTVVTFLAVYGALQLISWLPASVPDIAFGPFETQWPKLSRYLVNDICDAPGITGTRYGPCPGTPGFRMPGRATHLPGHKP